MSNYKPFEKNKRSIEEAIKIINELIDSVEEYGYDYTVEEAVVINKSEYNSIETLLTAYEKEKGENVKLRLQDIPLIEGELKAYKDRVNELKQELEKEKEKNKNAIDFINDKNNYFEDGENWENVLKIKKILGG